MDSFSPLPHGGRLRAAAARYDIPLSDWLDLSTGINPRGWPVPPLPPSVWTRLPEEDDGLMDAAAQYYGTPTLLPVAGSQAAIQALPGLRPAGRIGVLHPGYAEHAQAWRRAGHHVIPLAASQIDRQLAQLDVLVLIHPNNPGGERFSRDQLLAWHGQLAGRGGWLLVDEAFMDTTPQHSLAVSSPRPGLIILRSLGKFFGLAGARVGFVLAEQDLLQRLLAQLGPWTLAHPSRQVATLALADLAWQQAARRQLSEDGVRLQTLLCRHGLVPNGGCALFQWVVTDDAPRLHQALARQGILTRLFEAGGNLPAPPPSLRFGLPVGEPQWQRLDQALAGVTVGEARETPCLI